MCASRVPGASLTAVYERSEDANTLVNQGAPSDEVQPSLRLRRATLYPAELRVLTATRPDPNAGMVSGQGSDGSVKARRQRSHVRIVSSAPGLCRLSVPVF